MKPTPNQQDTPHRLRTSVRVLAAVCLLACLVAPAAGWAASRSRPKSDGPAPVVDTATDDKGPVTLPVAPPPAVAPVADTTTDDKGVVKKYTVTVTSGPVGGPTSAKYSRYPAFVDWSR